MTPKTVFDVCVLPGDGVGVEVIAATVPLIEQALQASRCRCQYREHPASAQHYRASGQALPAAALEAARQTDAVFFGAVGWPEIRYPDGAEIALDRFDPLQPPEQDGAS